MKHGGSLRTARPAARLRAGRADWYRITNNAALNTATIHVYDEIGYFGVTAAAFVDELNTLQVNNIDMHINSPGGDVFDGIAIYTALANHPANVTVTVDALAASIASVIAMAGDRIIMGRNAEMMIHDASGMTIGNAADHSEMVDMLNRASDNIASIYADRAGGEAEAWRDLMRAETWMSAQEAVDAGLADEVAPAKARPSHDDEPADDPAAPTDQWDLSVFAHTSRVDAGAPDLTTITRPRIDLAAIRNALQKGAAS